MLRKILIKIFGLSMVAGLFLILCTAGSSDLNLIDFKTILIRGGIGLLLCVLGFVGLKASNWEYIN